MSSWWLRELGYVEAVLWVVPDNQRARRLYESEGSRPTTWGPIALVMPRS